MLGRNLFRIFLSIYRDFRRQIVFILIYKSFLHLPVLLEKCCGLEISYGKNDSFSTNLNGSTEEVLRYGLYLKIDQPGTTTILSIRVKQPLAV